MNKDLKLKIKFEGGEADNHRLEIYEAGVSIHGLARATAISMHAFLNNGKVRSRVETIHGAKIYITPSQKGSFQEIITIVMEAESVGTIGTTVAATATWEFIKWSWAKAMGREADEPTSRHAKKILKENEDLEAELSIALESPLEQVHRPISNNEEVKISLSKNLTKDTIELNQESLDYVSTRTESGIEKGISGNVTRYNILSGNGRLYDDRLGRTISFGLDSDVSQVEKKLLTWSIDEGNSGRDGKLLLDVNRIINKRGETKRYVVVEVKEND
tara:strand:+ start:63 stop:884 length:822 start_codon:yes stop_codon:yes gene_type:complete